MKLSVDLCFLQVLISLACIETKGRTGLHKQRIGNLSQTVPPEEQQQDYVSIRNLQKNVANETERTGVPQTESVLKWKNEQTNSHPLVNNGGKTDKKCVRESCIRKNTAHFNTRRTHVIIRKNNRRTRSVFLARALDMLDHSQPDDSSNFASRSTSNKPFKLHNLTAHVNKAGSQVKKTQKPTKDQLGEKRQQGFEPLSEMRPRFIFNTAPAEFVEGTNKRKPGAIHISLPDPRPPRLHRMEPVFPLHGNHNPSNLAQLAITGPLPNQRAQFHSPLQQFDHAPYAVQLHTPPQIEPPTSPDNLPESVTHLGAPIRTEPPTFSMMHPPGIPTEPFPQGMYGPIDMPPMPPPSEMHIAPAVPERPFTRLNDEGMPPPVGIGPLLPPPVVQRVPVPVPIPSPPKIDHVPYPVPVPGHRSIQPVIVPVEVPSPPKIHEVPVPVESPPKIKNVPVPVPVPVPSPPQIKHVPYPVAVPVRGPPEVHKIFYPVGIRQPSQVHHVPYPVYIRFPPQIRRVPYAVPSPPKPYPVPVPSPPRVMINRVPYPVMVTQRVPFPVPIVLQHHHINENEGSYEESIYTGQCIVNLCRNGGTCSAYMSFYRCHCPKGYKGKHCEEQNMCRPNPCRNFGSCSEVEHDYECTCTKGFIGKNCDKADPCVPSPCDNGATCSSDGTTYSCTCRIGWIGKNCQVESKCLPINPCQNGGTCMESQGTYKCDCSPGWMGLSCEISAPETLTQVSAPATVPCDNCEGPGDILDQRNLLRHRPNSSKKWTVLKRKNKG